MTAGNFSADIWMSIAGTWDGTNVRSYVNGALDGTSAASSVPAAGSSQITLNGSSNYNSVPTFLFTGGKAPNWPFGMPC